MVVYLLLVIFRTALSIFVLINNGIVHILIHTSCCSQAVFLYRKGSVDTCQCDLAILLTPPCLRCCSSDTTVKPTLHKYSFNTEMMDESSSQLILYNQGHRKYDPRNEQEDNRKFVLAHSQLILSFSFLLRRNIYPDAQNCIFYSKPEARAVGGNQGRRKEGESWLTKLHCILTQHKPH